MLILLLLEFLSLKTKVRRMKLTLLFTSLFIAPSAAAQHQNRLIMRANNQYRQKQYDQAARSLRRNTGF